MTDHKRKLTVKSKRTFISMIALFPWLSGLSGCISTKKQMLTIPFYIPFDKMNVAGTVITTDFISPEDPIPWYAILAAKRVKGPTFNWGMYLRFTSKENDPQDRLRVSELMGKSYFKKKDGVTEWIDNPPGLPISLYIKIVSIDQTMDTEIYAKRVNVGRVASQMNNVFNRLIDHIRLAPGAYRVTVENIDPHPELLDTSIAFTISFTGGK